MYLKYVVQLLILIHVLAVRFVTAVCTCTHTCMHTYCTNAHIHVSVLYVHQLVIYQSFLLDMFKVGLTSEKFNQKRQT